tara:strand:+ start:21663 stop:21857 length:195 start_codon:yes stop_codon:yes gene_type:complete
MNKKKISKIQELEDKVDVLIKKYLEQKGIVESYIVKERSWKEKKINHSDEIRLLKKTIKELKNK